MGIHIYALPFDLRLWAGVNDTPISNAAIYTRFTERRDRVIEINRRLSDSTARDCVLRIMLTQRLLECLSNTPPWSEIRRGSNLYRLKRDVLTLLRNKHRAASTTLYLDIRNVAHLYTWEEPKNFFPNAVAPMQQDWIEMTGVCAFESMVSAQKFAQPLPVLATWVITTYSATAEAQLSRCPLEEEKLMEKRRVPLLSQTDIWVWERMVRKILWQDERLPFNGPNGPFGYCPPDDWRLDKRPRRHEHAYLDALGGLWEWEGGRAITEQNPFGGHWNIQLPNASVRRRWVTYLQERSGQTIQTRTDNISHINSEPDGSIGDKTFDWAS